MRKYVALIKVNLFAMLATFSGGRGKTKKRAASGIGAIALMAFLALYMSTVYSFMFAQALAPAGMLHLIPVLIAVMSFIMSLMFTCFAASGIVFGSKDNDLMLSLPLSSFAVMLSKIISLYLENLIFTLFMMTPACVAYLIHGGTGGALFVLRLIVASLFLPLFASFFALIVGFLLAVLQSKMGRNAILGNLSYLLFFVAIMYFAFQMNTLSMSLLTSGGKVDSAINNWLYPLALFRDGIYGNLLALLGFILITILPFLALVFIMSTQYKKMLTLLASTKTRKDYKLIEMKAQGVASALYKKEFGRYWGTPIYVFNTAFGVIMVAFAAGAGILYKDTVQSFLTQMGGITVVYPLLLLCVGFMCVTSASSCISISLEGKTLWILKEAPIETKHLFLPKALVNMTLIWAVGIISAPAAWYVLNISLLQAGIILFMCFALGVFVSLFGLLINLFFPKMDGTNDTLIVKQSASSFLGVFSGIAIVGIGAGAVFLCQSFLNAESTVLIMSALILIISFGIWKFLMTKGAKMLMRM